MYCSPAGQYRPANSVSIVTGTQVTDTGAIYSANSTPGRPAAPTEIQQIDATSGLRYFNYSITCTSPSGTTIRNTVLPEGVAPVSPIGLRNEVTARITIPNPTPAANPPLDDPARHSVVQIPTWFWINDPWQAITDTERRAGIEVSVSATPTKVVWDPGDGSYLECGTAGTPWIPGRTNTDCSHTYTRSSAGLPGDAYQISTTVHWSFTWTLNNVPQGEFATYEPTTVTDHQVGEIQIVNR